MIFRYSVLDLQTVAADMTSGEYFRMVQVRNPHGQGEWQGAPEIEVFWYFLCDFHVVKPATVLFFFPQKGRGNWNRHCDVSSWFNVCPQGLEWQVTSLGETSASLGKVRCRKCCSGECATLCLTGFHRCEVWSEYFWVMMSPKMMARFGCNGRILRFFGKMCKLLGSHTRRTRCAVQIESCVTQPKVVDCDTNIRTVAMPDYDEETPFLHYIHSRFDPIPMDEGGFKLKEPAITETIGQVVSLRSSKSSRWQIWRCASSKIFKFADLWISNIGVFSYQGHGVDLWFPRYGVASNIGVAVWAANVCIWAVLAAKTWRRWRRTWTTRG